MAWAERLDGGGWRGGWRDPDGKKHYTNKTTHPEHPYRRKSDAKDAAIEAEAKANRQAAVEVGTLAATIEWGDWWDLIADSRVSADTDTDLFEASVVKNYLRPHWGDKPLIKHKHKLVQAWVNALADGSCPEWKSPGRPDPTYVRRIYSTYQASIQRAVEDEVLDASPCAGIKLPKVYKKRAKQHITVADAEEIGPVLRADYRAAVDVALDTGLRPGELCGLHADRVDLDELFADIDWVYVDRKHVLRPWPKDKDARRVPLTRNAADIIRARLEGRDLTAGCGVPHSDDSPCESVLVFMTEAGRAMTPNGLRNRLWYAAKHNPVPHRSPYAARRGYMTRLARGGADPFAIAAAAGHASLEESQGYVQDARMGAVIRAALGEREPLTAVDGGRQDAAGELDGDPREASG
jgi:integrase